jgi:hypothetical protein
MTKPKIRPARLSDFLAFYGHPPKNTLKAIVVEVDGKVIGFGGVERHPGMYVAFSDISEQLQSMPVLLMKAAKATIELVKQCNRPVVTIQAAELATSYNFLIHLGFVPTEEPEVFLWRS